jgi:HAE1 family hydrophobic/amphiphilic exporter-1
MLIGTAVQLFVVPSLFAIFQWLQEKLTPLKFDDEENPDAAAELAQYAHCKKLETYVNQFDQDENK